MNELPLPRRKVTIRALAEAAGVSPATVDRVLNGRPNVHPGTVARVMELASLMAGQVTDPSRGGGLIHALVPSVENPFFNALAAALAEVLPPASSTIRRTDIYDARTMALALEEAGRTADAVAFVPFDHPMVREATQKLLAKDVRVILMLSGLSMDKVLPYVGQDNRGAGRTAGFLIGMALLHRPGTVGLVAGNMSFRAQEEREMGFRAIMREEFPHLRLTSTYESGDDPSAVERIVRGMLAKEPDLVGLYNLGGSTAFILSMLREQEPVLRQVCVQHDLTQATRAGLLGGELTAVVDQDVRFVARETAALLTQPRARLDVEIPRKLTPIHIFTKENLPPQSN